MKVVSLILLAIALVLAGAETQANQRSNAFITSSRAVQQDADKFYYVDSDLHHLVLHNMGLLSGNGLSDSNKRIISKYGESSLTRKFMLNYLFLLETNDMATTKKFIPQERQDATDAHHRVKLDVCSEDRHGDCVLDLLYNKGNEKSVVNHFEKFHGVQAHKGNYFYASNTPEGKMLRDFSYSLNYDKHGNVVIVEVRTGRRIPLNYNLDKCVNNVVGENFKVDFENGAMIFKKNYDGDVVDDGILLEGDNAKLVKAFMEDVCAIVSISNLLRKDPTPSMFTFYITSIAKLEAILDKDHKDLIHQIWNNAYLRFQDNLRRNFADEEVTGQMIFVRNKNGLKSMVYERKTEANMSFVEVRRLEEVGNAQVKDNQPLTKARVIYRVFGVAFVIVLALILVAMSSIEIQKDTLIYSKFLTGEQRKQ